MSPCSAQIRCGTDLSLPFKSFAGGGDPETVRRQLNVLQRKSPKRLAFSNFDRLVFASLYRIAPRLVTVLVIVEPELLSVGIVLVFVRSECIGR